MTARDALEFLASRRRTVLMGGTAVILHGLNRMTKDYDVWLDPLPNPEAWAIGIVELLEAASLLQARRIATIAAGMWTSITASEIAAVGSEDGMVRLAGLDWPIDVFYKPNELDVSDFEGVWQRSTPSDRGLRLMDKIDLLVTKQLTDRLADRADIGFLTGKVEEEYRARLKDCSEQEAMEMFERFATAEIAAFAIRESANEKVRELGWRTLEEMRTAGDPFAEELGRELHSKSQGLERD
ncbi:MAG: hypothetical protein JO232_01795 [Verrucomicrobia bacterium]|nr:hypothetical protein [Verrucomicrobiota bacterium]